MKYDIEYKGHYTNHLLPNICVGTVGLLTGSYEGTTAEGCDVSEPSKEEYRYILDEWWVVLVLSRLDGIHIRVAFQDDLDLEERSDKSYTPLESALGYAVDGEDFAEEVVKCGHEYLDYVAETGIDESEQHVSKIKQNVGRLEEIVE